MNTNDKILMCDICEEYVEKDTALRCKEPLCEMREEFCNEELDELREMEGIDDYDPIEPLDFHGPEDKTLMDYINDETKEY